MAEKIAVITGGTKGLGRALSIEFAGAGYDTLALYSRDTAAAASLEATFKAKKWLGRTLQLDITREAPIWTAYGGAKEIILINNAAAGFFPKPLHLLTWDDFHSQLEVTLKGAFLAMHSLYRMPRPTPRRTVVNILSQAIVDLPPKGFSAYALAKQSLLYLSQIWANDQTAGGLRLLCVSPGYMETSMTDPWPETLKSSLKNASSTPIETIATRVRELVEDQTLPGKGENYPV
jgi:3-oxoacyl-[acyl-carrier protein] reductase